MKQRFFYLCFIASCLLALAGATSAPAPSVSTSAEYHNLTYLFDGPNPLGEGCGERRLVETFPDRIVIYNSSCTKTLTITIWR